MLPWMDHGNAYGRLQSDTPGGVGGFSDTGNPNMDVLDGLYVEPYRCPSSAVPQWASVKELLPCEDIKFLGASYVGISGAAFRNGAVNPDSAYVFSGPVVLNGNPISVNDGTIHANNGILLQNQCIAIRDIKDGTTTTIMVAEQSTARFMLSTPAGADLVDAPNLVLSSYPGSAWPGTGLKTTVKSGDTILQPHMVSNVTTLRYPINMQHTANLGGLGLGAGNKPIMSAHLGGAQVLFADGGVRMLNESIDFNTLMSLADRKDGNVISGAF
jgi:prepilin-type processing-associated H-X9-DG protein